MHASNVGQRGVKFWAGTLCSCVSIDCFGVLVTQNLLISCLVVACISCISISISYLGTSFPLPSLPVPGKLRLLYEGAPMAFICEQVRPSVRFCFCFT